MAKVNIKVKSQRKEQTPKNALSLFLTDNWSETIRCGYTPLSKNPEIDSAISKLAELISSMTIHLIENGDNGDVRIKNALSRLVDITPSKWMTRKTFIYNIVYEMLINGNTIVIPITNSGNIDYLRLIPWENVILRANDYDGYTVYVNGEQYTPDDVLHFINRPRMPYPWKGTGYEVSLSTVVKNLNQAAKTKNVFLESKWKPSLVIKADGVTDSMGNELKREKILDTYIKTAREGEPWLIPADVFDITEIRPLSLNDLAINEAVNIDKKTAAAIIGVPEFVVGVGSFNKEEWNNFINTKIKPLCNSIEQELTRKLLISPNWYFRFNVKSLYSYDIETLSTVGANLYTRGIMTGNEVRDWIGENPRDGLDDLVILENYIPQGMIGEQKKLNGGGES